ncbi:hypothetical protein BRADI_2g02203v3 [Brachypodium distachyon]|uniref:Uncharacterized protein n=1 Tax=Brachypodium distachyon TaxID=15368 RepID=A0A2K2D6H9_BRADI|nr:hypothetical protein BRADI_2g02203v3 [Brachypodium distachyon]
MTMQLSTVPESFICPWVQPNARRGRGGKRWQELGGRSMSAKGISRSCSTCISDGLDSVGVLFCCLRVLVLGLPGWHD